MREINKISGYQHKGSGTPFYYWSELTKEDILELLVGMAHKTESPIRIQWSWDITKLGTEVVFDSIDGREHVSFGISIGDGETHNAGLDQLGEGKSLSMSFNNQS